MIQSCIEQVLEDVLRVDVVLATDCDLAVPIQESVTEMEGVMHNGANIVDRIGTPVLSLAYSVQDNDDGEIESAPSLKQTEKVQQSGIIVSHDLQVPVTAGFETTRKAVSDIMARDFHVVLTTERCRYLLYSLPNTSGVTLDETGVEQSATVKISLNSMSHVIRLVDNL